MIIPIYPNSRGLWCPPVPDVTLRGCLDFQDFARGWYWFPMVVCNLIALARNLNLVSLSFDGQLGINPAHFQTQLSWLLAIIIIEKIISYSIPISSSGWWFGPFFIVPYIGNVIIPTDFNSMIFQRGRAQPPTRSPYHLGLSLYFAGWSWFSLDGDPAPGCCKRRLQRSRSVPRTRPMRSRRKASHGSPWNIYSDHIYWAKKMG